MRRFARATTVLVPVAVGLLLAAISLGSPKAPPPCRPRTRGG